MVIVSDRGSQPIDEDCEFHQWGKHVASINNLTHVMVDYDIGEGTSPIIKFQLVSQAFLYYGVQDRVLDEDFPTKETLSFGNPRTCEQPIASEHRLRQTSHRLRTLPF
ncbi:hypothetical protein PanWU01x14_136340 [Parasponia andersonii]|uniref:Uncharacterized protein n=1 Tax=Parasponia andersonii TaxID=3476 RepID=A0A2P5CNX9_PARAD|nr:hypothetical protein PanWU01x14_136340 [Parasponia andersonii]